MSPIQRAVKMIGGQSATARAINKTPQAVQKWCANGNVPASSVLVIEALTGHKVSRHELRPDLYPEPSAKKANRKRAATAAPAETAA